MGENDQKHNDDDGGGTNDGHDDRDSNVEDDDIYIMMICVSVCLLQKMITSSLESPVTTTCNRP